MDFTRKAIPYNSKTKMADIQDYPNKEGKVRSYIFTFTLILGMLINDAWHMPNIHPFF